MDSFVGELINIADNLDKKGHTVEAAEIDNMMQRNPVAGGVVRFAEGLKERLRNDKELDALVKSKVLVLIDEMIAQGGFFAPEVGVDIDNIKKMVMSLAEYENAVMQLTEDLRGASGDKKIEIEADLSGDRKRLNELYNETEDMLHMLSLGKNEGDLDNYNRFFELYMKHTGRRYHPYNI